jgi:hypothetical protein
MQIAENPNPRNVPLPDRPALATLIAAMERLSRPQRTELIRMGRRARAAKVPRLRRLTWEAAREARRLTQVAQ